MSASILSFPERGYTPDILGAFEVIDTIEKRPKLITVALGSLRLIDERWSRGAPYTHADGQRLVNAAALAFLAMAEYFQIPRDRLIKAIIGELDDGGAA